ncbi:hypothetical protein [Lactococcus lactis]|uniref:hypothetical protein n=1 Tax=Lactococcus lactis TaxID=1358 RepID=UPI00223BEAC7|nr:hypothetical protein [Lactococcus lactis]MCT0449316.1 hypothetical protein [Lactococcus lactis subsp. lactis]
MEFILFAVLVPFSVGLGLELGKLIPAVGDRICEFNSYIKNQIGVSPEEIVLTSIFVAFTATFWTFNSALGSIPIWINMTVKVVMTIVSVLLMLLLVFNLVIHFVEEFKR